VHARIQRVAVGHARTTSVEAVGERVVLRTAVLLEARVELPQVAGIVATRVSLQSTV